MNDLSLQDAGNGGDAILRGNDLEGTDSFFNMAYIALFGGNPGFSTTGNELDTEERFDWWGNSALFQDEPAIQINSLTEHILNTTELSSQGRVIIENSVKKDLEFFSTFAEVEVNVSIPSVLRMQSLCSWEK